MLLTLIAIILPVAMFASPQVNVQAKDFSDLITPEKAVALYSDVVRKMEKPLKVKGCSLSQLLQGTQEEWSRPGGSRPLMVFVSFSMSDQDLKSLFHDVHRLGGRLVMRGLHHNSWKTTAQKLTFLKITVDIDPEAFDLYHVTTVPQFVLQGAFDTRASGTVSDTVFDILKGNVSLKFALETFSQQGSLKAEALRLLKKLRAS